MVLKAGTGMVSSLLLQGKGVGGGGASLSPPLMLSHTQYIQLHWAGRSFALPSLSSFLKENVKFDEDRLGW